MGNLGMVDETSGVGENNFYSGHINAAMQWPVRYVKWFDTKEYLPSPHEL